MGAKNHKYDKFRDRPNFHRDVRINLLTYHGITLSHKEWSVALGYGHDTIRDRIVNLGWNETKAIEKGVFTHSLYQHQIETLGKTFYNNKVAFYLDMGL